jgi:hypothetical protein
MADFAIATGILLAWLIVVFAINHWLDSRNTSGRSPMAETKDGGAATYPITFNLLHDDPIVRAASLLNMSVQSFIAGAAQGEAERLLAARTAREASDAT